MPDTAQRRLEPELMDDPNLGFESHRGALRGLARINTISRSAASIWGALHRRLRPGRTRSFRVLDIACGGGDVALALSRLAKRSRLNLRVDGCDLSATAVGLASAHAERCGLDAGFFRLDALSDPLPLGYDAIVTNLFLHHLSHGAAVALLKRVSSAAPVVVVNDLARGRLGYVGAVVGTRLLSRSPIVHVDGPRSVRAAFTIPEARELASAAGLVGARVRPIFPWRFILEWSRP